jgi:hypothetical protein
MDRIGGHRCPEKDGGTMRARSFVRKEKVCPRLVHKIAFFVQSFAFVQPDFGVDAVNKA